MPTAAGRPGDDIMAGEPGAEVGPGAVAGVAPGAAISTGNWPARNSKAAKSSAPASGGLAVARTEGEAVSDGRKAVGSMAIRPAALHRCEARASVVAPPGGSLRRMPGKACRPAGRTGRAGPPRRWHAACDARPTKAEPRRARGGRPLDDGGPTMSLFGSLTAAISGLTSQSRSLGNISDNIANSQTVGYKRVDTNFISYITSSSQTNNLPGATIAAPAYTNTVQGTIEQSENPLAMAIGGQGFFSVAQAKGSVNGQPVFDERQFFSRAGDFSRDADGYLTNGSGYYLKGWPVGAGGNPDRTTIEPIRVNQQVFNPIATKQIELAANLPATLPTGAVGTQAQLYDTLGRLHTVDLSFSPGLAANSWTLEVTVPDDIAPTTRTVELNFGATSSPPVADGTIGSFGAASAMTVPATFAEGDPAVVSFSVDFGQGPQNVSLSLGQFGRAVGLTQYEGSEFALRNLTQDGVPLGAFSSLSMRTNGDVAVNYDNGQSRVIARVPLVAFNDPDKLQRLDGQAFMRTPDSGEARVTDAASNGVGKIVVGSIERSNVDIASEFSKLIVAQRAYTANTKVVSATDELLQDTINMRR
jgi:flagellar hook protein FlgE